MDHEHQNTPAGAPESGILSAAPDGQLHPLVVPFDAPNESGWWWGRSKEKLLPGDEFCVEVTIKEGGRVELYWGRDWGYLDEWTQFHGCDWIKATSPWHNAENQATASK